MAATVAVSPLVDRAAAAAPAARGCCSSAPPSAPPASALLVLADAGRLPPGAGRRLASGATDAPRRHRPARSRPGGMGMVTLAMSVVTVAWAVYALRQRRPPPRLPRPRPHAAARRRLHQLHRLPVPAAGAAAHRARPPAALLYIVTGAHLVMVVVGLVFVAVMGFQALGGQLTGRDAEGMTAAALYWYVTVAVYAAIWYGIYITK